MMKNNMEVLKDMTSGEMGETLKDLSKTALDVKKSILEENKDTLITDKNIPVKNNVIMAASESMMNHSLITFSITTVSTLNTSTSIYHSFFFAFRALLVFRSINLFSYIGFIYSNNFFLSYSFSIIIY